MLSEQAGGACASLHLLQSRRGLLQHSFTSRGVGGFSVISDDTVSTTFTELVFHASSGIQSSFVSPLPASAQSVTNRRVLLLAAGGAITAAVLPPVVAAEASGVTGSCFPCMSAAGGTPSLEINGPSLHHVLER